MTDPRTDTNYRELQLTIFGTVEVCITPVVNPVEQERKKYRVRRPKQTEPQPHHLSDEALRRARQ